MPDFLYFYPKGSPKDGKCQNCNTRPKNGERLNWLFDWGYWACESCAEELNLFEKSQRLCLNLHALVLECKSIREIQLIMNTHSCELCRGVVEERKAA